VPNIHTFRISPSGGLIAASPNSIIFARDWSVKFHPFCYCPAVAYRHIKAMPALPPKADIG
jgi:hypothetical protein